ncbi:MAG: hypothetical protein IH955_09135 [Chloroflexi bacterium]|nr:hypothetical protein [Chloroflexota bacterium]
MERRSPADRPEHLVYCLSIDLIRSTEAGLKLTTHRLDIFNKSLTEQITSHLENLELMDVLLKFTGDGWLLMTDAVDKARALCCLATIMASRFQDEMSRETGISKEKISPLKLAVCAGRDMRVELPDGSSDWVGDSARRAVRAGNCCSPNEILVSEPVRDIVLRDFAHESANVEQRPLDQRLKEGEEALTLYVLEELKLEAATELGAFECYVYTLDVIGKKEEAAAAAPQWAEAMRREGIQPDVVTYNILISNTSNYETAEAWVETMRR